MPCPALPCPLISCPFPALPCSALPYLTTPGLPRPALPCPALPCPSLPCPALPCPALHALPFSGYGKFCNSLWQVFVIPYILASVIKSLLDRFGQAQSEMSAARLVTGARKYDLIPLVLRVLAVSGVFKGATGPCPFWPKNQFLTKEKIGIHSFPFIYLFKKNSSKHSNVDTN